MRPLSTIEGIERLTLYDSGLSDCKIARIQGCSGSAIAKWRNRIGLISKKHGNYLSEEEESRRLNAYHCTQSLWQAAKMLNIPVSVFYAWSRSRNLPSKGEWSETIVETIRRRTEAFRLRKDGLNDLEIALRLGLIPSTSEYYTLSKMFYTEPFSFYSRCDDKCLKAMKKVKIMIGTVMISQCRKDAACPYKALLPEVEVV